MNGIGSRRQKTGDVALAAVAIAVLLAFVAVLVGAPKGPKLAGLTAAAASSPAAVSTSPATSPVSTSPVNRPVVASTPQKSPTGSSVAPTASTPRTAPTPTPLQTPEATSNSLTKGLRPCSEISPGSFAAMCVTERHNVPLNVGDQTAVVETGGLAVSVDSVDTLKSRPGQVQIRIRGHVNFSHGPREIPRSAYYLGYHNQRFTSTPTGTGLGARRLHQPTEFRVAFEIPDALARAATKPGRTIRFVFAGPGKTLTTRSVLGVFVLGLDGAVD